MGPRLLLIGALLSAVLATASAPAQAQSAEAQGQVAGQASDPAPGEWSEDRWYLGAYYRHIWVPEFVRHSFLDRAPGVQNHATGIVATRTWLGPFRVQFGLGWAPYHFEGAVLKKDGALEETEWVKSEAHFIHATASFLWAVNFHKMVGLDLGLGLDFGFFTGDVVRTEAYVDRGGNFRPCDGPLMPPTVGPSGDPFCGVPDRQDMQADDSGEHYGVVEDRYPPVMLVPMLPHVALRFEPHPMVMIKVEYAFGLVQMFAGASVHVAMSGYPRKVEEEPEVVPVVVPAGPPSRRVLGKILEKGIDAPVVGATARLMGQGRAPLLTDQHGLFFVQDVPPGVAHFQVMHPDYRPSECEVSVPEAGGDTALYCYLEARPRFGFVSGSLKNDQGQPVAGAVVRLMGPNARELASDDEGLFAAPDLPPGEYTLRVDADDYLLQMLTLQVVAGETAMPELVLKDKPKHTLVKVKKKEIVIKEQVTFKINSAQIEASSFPLLNEIADVLLSYTRIKQVEIQGHTDNTGRADRNLKLSQERAEAVRARLLSSGVEPERLTARGYGQGQAIVPNNNKANRARNRRVQFIILRQEQQ